MTAILTAAPDLLLEADAITGLTDGAAVSTWNDGSGNGRNATAGSAPTYKTAVAPSGLPAVRFNGTSNYLNSSASISATAQTVIAAVQITATGGGNRTIRGGQASGGISFHFDTNNKGVVEKQGVTSIATAVAPVSSGWHVAVLTFTVSTWNMRVDGYTVGSGTMATVTPTAGQLTAIGRYSTGGYYFSGDMGTVASWSRQLSVSEIQGIEAELSTKWGTPTPNTIEVTASSATSGWPPPALVDGNLGTAPYAWAGGSQPPQWVRAQFPTSRTVTGYTITARPDDAGAAPKDWTFEGSPDGSTWTTLDTRTGQTFTASQARTYAAANSTAYLYYRLNITANSTGGITVPSFTEWGFTYATAGASGGVAATLPTMTVAATGTVTGPTSGAMGASLPSLTASVGGTIPAAATGAVAATMPSLTARVATGNPTLGAISLSAKASLTANVPTITLVPMTVSLAAKASLTAATRTFEFLSVSLTAAADLRVNLPRHQTIDPVTGLPQYRLLAITQDGTALGELPRAAIGDYQSGLSLDDERLDFTLPKYDATNALVTARDGDPVREVQLWRGPNLEAWVKVDGDRPGDGVTEYDCSSLAGYLKGRVVGKTPKTDWLINGNFTQGDYGWSFGFEPGSKPAAPPTHSIVNADFAGTVVKALQLGGADTVTEVKQAVETAAVFVPNSATYLSGGEAKIQAAASSIPNGTDVHIVGHTAYNYLDGDYGDGLLLSLNRARAARATLAAMGKGFTFSIKPNLGSPNMTDSSLGVAGRGRYEPVASNDTYAGQAKNRRVEFSYSATVTYDASAAQYAQGSLITGTVTVPVATKRALPITFRGYAYLSEIVKASKAGYGVRITLAKASAPSVILQDEHSDLNEDSPLQTWDRHTATVTVPSNGIAYEYKVYLYAPKGTVLWTMAGVYPAEALHFPDTDRALIVKGLVEHAQDPAMAKLGDWPILIGTRTPLTGHRLTKTYPYHERREILDAVAEHSAVHDGVDLSMDPATRALVTHSPRRGQASGVTFELGSNVVAYEAPTSVTDAATRVITQALESSGAEREEGIVTDMSGLGGVLVERVAYAEPETPVTELEASSRSVIIRSGHPVTDLTVTIGRVGRWDPALTSWMLDHVKVGDVVDVVIIDGTVSVVGPHRVIRRTLTPDTDTLRYALAPDPVEA